MQVLRPLSVQSVIARIIEGLNPNNLVVHDIGPIDDVLSIPQLFT